jgi:hypothetical protein
MVFGLWVRRPGWFRVERLCLKIERPTTLPIDKTNIFTLTL